MQSKKRRYARRYAVVHKDGPLVRGIGNPFVDFSFDFSRAMTFSTKKDAENTARAINDMTRKAGGLGVAYSVVEKSDYKRPNWYKRDK